VSLAQPLLEQTRNKPALVPPCNHSTVTQAQEDCDLLSTSRGALRLGRLARVLFSDKTKLLCVNVRGRSWCWREPGQQPLCARAVKPSKKYAGGSILLWRCMSANWVGNLCRIFVIVTGSVYTEILERHMLPSTAWLLPRGCTDFILQQDDDPKHTSRRAQRWLEANHVATLAWPAKSPDLNPIEHLWAIVKQRVCEGPPLGYVKELWERLERTWWDIEHLCRQLVESMPARIEAVIEARGGYTRY